MIGNPPYNTNQDNENDDNKIARYGGKQGIDSRIAATYAADSNASLRNKLSDPYVKAFRWASDRIGTEGIVGLVTNNGFLDQLAFDGMRKNLSRDYSRIYALDLGGNVRKNPHLSGTTHNVFGIQVGVSITLLIKHAGKPKEVAKVFYARFAEMAKRAEKLVFLTEKDEVSKVVWQEIPVSENGSWNVVPQDPGFAAYLTMGVRDEKGTEDVRSIFRLYSLGVSTNRDAWVFNHSRLELANTIRKTMDGYSAQLARWNIARQSHSKFVLEIDDKAFKWTERLIATLGTTPAPVFDDQKIRCARYRPFDQQFLYFDRLLNERGGLQRQAFPVPATEGENQLIIVTGHSQVPFFCPSVQRTHVYRRWGAPLAGFSFLYLRRRRNQPS